MNGLRTIVTALALLLAAAPAHAEGVAAKRDQLKYNIDMNQKIRVFKRDQVPQDLVGALLFLCSTDSDFLTGQTLVVDGGAHMH